MGINGVSSYANTYTYGNVKNENVKPSKNSEKNYYAGYTMNSANKFKNVSDYSKYLTNNNLDLYQGTITFRSGLNVVTKQLANYSTDTWIYTADDIGSGTWTVTVSGYAVGTTQNVKYGIKREIEI